MAVNQTRLIEEFIELVKINSETGQERTIANILKDKFSRLGLQVIEDESPKQTHLTTGNLICTLKGHPHIKPMHFTAHMDTVKPAKHVQPVIDQSYIRSDGKTILGADDKVGIAAMLELIRQLKEQSIVHGDIQFILTVGEEAGLIGAKALDRDLITAHFGYVLDGAGTVGQIITTSPRESIIRITITVKQLNDPMKMSAVAIAKRVIKQLRLGDMAEDVKSTFHKYTAGTHHHVQYVLIEMRIQSFSKRTSDNVIRALTKRLQQTVNQSGGEVKVDEALLYPELCMATDAKLIQLAAKAAHKIGQQSDYMTISTGNDANIINALGIPTTTLAVGFERIHTTEERIHIDEMKALINWLLAIIKCHTAEQMSCSLCYNEDRT